jgi:hypothetical protein
MDIQSIKKNVPTIKDIFIVADSNNIIKWSIIGIIVIAFAYLVFLSIIIKDIAYPMAHPYLFTLETLLTAFGTGSLIFLMAYGRNKITSSTFFEFGIMVLKFGLLNILLQFSGFYTYVFS